MRARRRFAQHFLEPAWSRKLLDAVAVQPSDAILEIGPGRGALTAGLAARARWVTAIEIDRDLAAGLREREQDNVTLVEGDVLDIDLGALVRDLQARGGEDGRVRLVGNLPYNISSPILLRLMRLARDGAPLADAVIMLQREVADRIAAAPGTGDWGPLSLAVQWRADVTRLLALPPGAFRPPPRVHSTVLRLAFHPPRVPVGDEALMDSIVRGVFAQRRKTLLNALRPLATARADDAGRLLRAAGLDPQQRPERVDAAGYARLADAFEAAPGDARGAAGPDGVGRAANRRE